ncbi:MAG: CbiQ family ECF transporter T component [Chloroflexota bacterium]
MLGSAPRLLTYQVGDSALHRLDPRAKLMATAGVVAAVLLAGGPASFVIAYGLGAIAGTLAGRAVGQLWRTLRPLLILIFLFGLLITVVTPGQPLAHILILVPTLQGVELGIRLGLQALLIVYTTSLLTLTTPPLALADALESLTGFLQRVRFPVRDIIAMVGIGLTFVPLLIEEVQKVIAAQRARGATLGVETLLDEHSMGALMIPLLLANLRRGEELAASMEARLYATGPRTSLYERHYHRRDLFAGLAVAVALAAIIYLSFFRGVATSTVPAPNSIKERSVAVPAIFRPIKTVFLIVMENHNWSSIRSNPSARYLNHRMLPHASFATRYYNPPGLHPSLPNYLWLEAGTNCFHSTGCIRDDLPPSFHSTATDAHLTSLLSRAHVSWRAYEEGATTGSCPTSDLGLYAPKHDAFVYFHDVTHRQRYCLSHVRPYSSFSSDLVNGTIGRYNFITPNLCDDMHNRCSPLEDPVRQGDVWLSHIVPQILHSKEYRKGGALFVTWDEGEGGDGPIGMIVMSPYARGHGYHDSVHYTHSSTLRTLQEIFGVRPFLGAARHSNDLRALFK